MNSLDMMIACLYGDRESFEIWAILNLRTVPLVGFHHQLEWAMRHHLLHDIHRCLNHQMMNRNKEFHRLSQYQDRPRLPSRDALAETDVHLHLILTMYTGVAIPLIDIGWIAEGDYLKGEFLQYPLLDNSW
jgi:hypothetical protein